MLERLALLFVLLLGLAVLYLAVGLSGRVRRNRRVNRIIDPALSEGRPTVLFFTADYCSVCHHRQRPALDHLLTQLDGSRDLRVVEVDAAADTSLAKRFGVLTLPSTVVLSPEGRVGAVNYGFAPSEQLRAQVASVV